MGPKWEGATKWGLLTHLPALDPGASPEMVRWAHWSTRVSSAVSEGDRHSEPGNGGKRDSLRGS